MCHFCSLRLAGAAQHQLTTLKPPGKKHKFMRTFENGTAVVNTADRCVVKAGYININIMVPNAYTDTPHHGKGSESRRCSLIDVLDMLQGAHLPVAAHERLAVGLYVRRIG